MNRVFSDINEYYTKKVEKFGATPAGVDWNDEESQHIRFEQLMNVLSDQEAPFAINDLGCGYGGMIDFFQEKYHQSFSFVGYDLSQKMIDSALDKYSALPNCSFSCIEQMDQVNQSDYTVASGIFNVRMEHSEKEWLAYILETIDQMDASSSKGFAFNMLTKYSDKERMRDDLYYGDPCFFFDYCKKNFSRNVSLTHDYDLYEFTIIVRKDR
ncbi:class I SAM-dependent methyltransferase [Pseudomonadota bacterium]